MQQEELSRLRTEFIPTWAGLRSIGNSRAVQASAAFPIIGYLVLLSTQVTSVFDGGLAGSTRQASNWWSHLWELKLYYVYFGLLHLGVGAAIYQWRCPRQIKKHGDWEDYVRIDLPSMTNEYVAAIGATLGLDFREDVSRPGESWDSLKIHYLRLHYAVLSAESPFWRLIVSYLFLFGLSLLAIPSIMTALKIGALFFGDR